MLSLILKVMIGLIMVLVFIQAPVYIVAMLFIAGAFTVATCLAVFADIVVKRLKELLTSKH